MPHEMQEMNCGMPHEMQSNMYMFYHATLDRCPYQGSKASHYAKAYLSNFGLPSKHAAHKPQSPQAFNAAALIFLRMSSFDATVYFMEKEGPSWIRALNCDLEVSSASVNVFFTELSLATFSALAFFAGRAFLASVSALATVFAFLATVSAFLATASAFLATVSALAAALAFALAAAVADLVALNATSALCSPMKAATSLAASVTFRLFDRVGKLSAPTSFPGGFGCNQQLNY